MNRCDFCCDLGVTMRYPARSFEDGHGGRSIGDWAACDVCHGLIQANAREALARRGLGEVQRRCPSLGRLTVADLYAYVLGLHDKFRANRTGDPTPIGVTVPLKED